MSADVLAVADADRRIVASGGPQASSWARGLIIGNPADANTPSDRALAVGSGLYHVISVPLQLGEAVIGSLELGTSLDNNYARELADLSRGQAAILANGRVVASTVSGPAARDLAAYSSAGASG